MPLLLMLLGRLTAKLLIPVLGPTLALLGIPAVALLVYLVFPYRAYMYIPLSQKRRTEPGQDTQLGGK